MTRRERALDPLDYSRNGKGKINVTCIRCADSRVWILPQSILHDRKDDPKTQWNPNMIYDRGATEFGTNTGYRNSLDQFWVGSHNRRSFIAFGDLKRHLKVSSLTQ